jgi:hypothetical protein
LKEVLVMSEFDVDFCRAEEDREELDEDRLKERRVDLATIEDEAEREPAMKEEMAGTVSRPENLLSLSGKLGADRVPWLVLRKSISLRSAR